MKKLKLFLTIIILSCSSLLYSSATYADSTTQETTVNQDQQITPININTASAQEIADGLSGIGLKKAQNIVEYRDKFGPFVAIEQLKDVSGIGQATLDKNVGKITIK